MEHLLAALKLPARVIATLGVVAIVALVLPDALLKILGVLELRNEHRPWLVLTAAISAAYLLVTLVIALFSWARDKVQRSQREAAEAAQRQAAEVALREREVAENKRRDEEAAKQQQARLAFLNGMTEEERAQCRKYIERERRTVWLNAESGVVLGLVERGVLRGAGTPGHYDTGFEAWGAEFTMNDWAWDHLREHPDAVANHQRGRRR